MGYVAVEYVSARSMKVRIQIDERSNGASFVVGFAPTPDMSNAAKKTLFGIISTRWSRGYPVGTTSMS